MSDAQVQTFHNSKPDDEQQQIIEDFSMASKPIRVLVTSDIAAEGVNLHKQCHHLIHVDLPWSLITLEQRNGRIDRYGQLHPPEIRYLVYQPADEEIASDMRVVSRLIAKEHAAHRALGDVASVMGLYSESDEEEHVRDALRKRTAAEREQALEEAAPEPAGFDPWAFAGLARPRRGSRLTPGAARRCRSSRRRRCSPATTTTSRRPCTSRSTAPARDIGWETDGPVLSFKPPDDLLRRLSALPQSYLRQRNLAERLRLTADAATARTGRSPTPSNQRADSEETGTAWPEIHHLGPQHPVLEWIADKILYRVGRDEAIALACDVTEPVCSSRASGRTSSASRSPPPGSPQPSRTAWSTFEDMHAALARAGVRAGMVNPRVDRRPRRASRARLAGRRRRRSHG